MDTLVLYQKISDIKPEYHALHRPFLRPSARKIQFNLLELDLHYLEEFGAYVDKETLAKFAKKGGAPKSKQKIKVVAMQL